jgi:ABC-type transport system involved in cytochrome c biogenesis permease component
MILWTALITIVALVAMLLALEIHTAHRELQTINATMPCTEQLIHIAKSASHALLSICYTVILAALLYLIARVAEEIGKT